MSLYVRVIPSKLCSFVGTKHQMMQFDQRLTKLIRLSALTHEANLSPKRITQDEIKLNSLTSITTREIDFNALNSQFYSTLSKLSEKSSSITKSENLHRSMDDKNNTSEKKSDGPTQEQLQIVYNTLEHDLPKFFTSTLNYNIYHKDLEFVNHFKGVKTQGIVNYMKQTTFIKAMGHLSYVYVKFDILKITLHPEDNTIKVRWRIRGLSLIKAIRNFYKFTLLKFSKDMERVETWYDGFSTFFVGPDGKVFRHVADKMMPDNDTVQDKDKTDIAAKLAA